MLFSLWESASVYPKYLVVGDLCIQQQLVRGQVTVMSERSLVRSYSLQCQSTPLLCADHYQVCLYGNSGFIQ